MARNPTPAERETLLALRDGPILWGTAPGARLTVLRRLNELGLIESSGAFEAKGAYQITPAGRAALAAEEGPRPSLTEAIEAVRQAGGKDWDKIADVQEYLGRKEDGELARLRAENERLRAALAADLSDYSPVFPPPAPPGATERTYRQVGETPSPDDPVAAMPTDTIDPEAWAALAGPPESPRAFRLERVVRDAARWDVTIYGCGDGWGYGTSADLNAAIRAAIAQAEGREGDGA